MKSAQHHRHQPKSGQYLAKLAMVVVVNCLDSLEDGLGHRFVSVHVKSYFNAYIKPNRQTCVRACLRVYFAYNEIFCQKIVYILCYYLDIFKPSNR